MGWINWASWKTPQDYGDGKGTVKGSALTDTEMDGNLKLIGNAVDSLAAATAQFDLVIDSNSKLDTWCNATSGTYKRVLIKAGTWTSSITNPTGGKYINLDSGGPGTVYVFAEKGASLVFNPNTSSLVYGFWHNALTTDLTAEKFDGVKISITNSGTSAAIPFYKCTNLFNCSATCVAGSVSIPFGFGTCNYLYNCTATVTGTNNSATGFDTCNNLINCIATVTGGAASPAYGFYSCNYLEGCTATATGGSTSGEGNGIFQSNYITACKGVGIGTGSGAGYGIRTSSWVSASVGIGTGGATGIGGGFFGCTATTSSSGTGTGGATSGAGYGFSGCVGVVCCSGLGLATGSGVGYGFFNSTGLQQNQKISACKTATYNTSFADHGSANATADTAAGGYNAA